MNSNHLFFFFISMMLTLSFLQGEEQTLKQDGGTTHSLYSAKIADLTHHFGDLRQMHIVELGAGGEGVFCKALHDSTGFASYTIIDVPEQLEAARSYLNAQGIDRVFFITSDELDSIQQCDLLLSPTALPGGSLAIYPTLEALSKKALNGYLPFTVPAKSPSLESLIPSLYLSGKRGKVQPERGSEAHTHVLTWKPGLSASTSARIKPRLEPSESLQTQNAVNYTFSGGRLGDNLLAYLHGKWIAFKYNLPLLNRSFPDSDQFHFEKDCQKVGDSFLFKQDHFVTDENQLSTEPSSTLFTVPYFPDTRFEREFNKLHWLPYFDVDWSDPQFRAEIREDLKPVQPIKSMKLPRNKLLLALHVRRGGGIDQAGAYMTWPLKFPPDEYYIEQLKRVAAIYQDREMYVYIFTDDLNPSAILETYRQALNNPKIEFACRTKGNGPTRHILEDFYQMTKFDCLIGCQSNFSLISSFIGDQQLVIMPTNAYFIDKQLIIDQTELTFRPTFEP